VSAAACERAQGRCCTLAAEPCGTGWLAVTGHARVPGVLSDAAQL